MGKAQVLRKMRVMQKGLKLIAASATTAARHQCLGENAQVCGHRTAPFAVIRLMS